MRFTALTAWRPRLLATVAIVSGTVWGSGCAPKKAPYWAPHAETGKLPEKHQQEIAKYLDQYFGTASDPQFKLPSSEPANAPAAEAAGDGAASGPKLADHMTAAQLRRGAAVYLNQCAQCHGESGDGQGPTAAYLDPRPRDYRRGIFKFGSTPFGSKPRREDLARVIRRGAKGTSMPSFRWMSDDDAHAVIDYVIMLSSRGEFEGRMLGLARELEPADAFDPEEVSDFLSGVVDSWSEAANKVVQPLTPMPRFTPAEFAPSARLFVEMSCYKCHGVDGQGRPIGQNDAWGNPAKSANIASGMLRGGRRTIDIYRRIHSGINGTPMPGSSQPGAGESPEDRSQKIWQLTYFVTRIAEGERFTPELVRDLETLAAELEAKAAGGAAAEPTPTPENPAPPAL